MKITHLFCSLAFMMYAVSMNADELKLTLVHLDTTYGSIAQAWPKPANKKDSSFEEHRNNMQENLLKCSLSAQQSNGALLAAVLSSSEAKLLLSKLGEDAKTVDRAKHDLSITATRNESTSELLNLSFSYGQVTTTGEFWENYQVPVIVTAKPGDNGFGVYLLLLK